MNSSSLRMKNISKERYEAIKHQLDTIQTMDFELQEYLKQQMHQKYKTKPIEAIPVPLNINQSDELSLLFPKKRIQFKKKFNMESLASLPKIINPNSNKYVDSINSIEFLQNQSESLPSLSSQTNQIQGDDINSNTIKPHYHKDGSNNNGYINSSDIIIHSIDLKTFNKTKQDDNTHNSKHSNVSPTEDKQMKHLTKDTNIYPKAIQREFTNHKTGEFSASNNQQPHHRINYDDEMKERDSIDNTDNSKDSDNHVNKQLNQMNVKVDIVDNLHHNYKLNNKLDTLSDNTPREHTSLKNNLKHIEYTKLINNIGNDINSLNNTKDNNIQTDVQLKDNRKEDKLFVKQNKEPITRHKDKESNNKSTKRVNKHYDLNHKATSKSITSRSKSSLIDKIETSKLPSDIIDPMKSIEASISFISDINITPRKVIDTPSKLSSNAMTPMKSTELESSSNIITPIKSIENPLKPILQMSSSKSSKMKSKTKKSKLKKKKNLKSLKSASDDNDKEEEGLDEESNDNTSISNDSEVSLDIFENLSDKNFEEKIESEVSLMDFSIHDSSVFNGPVVYPINEMNDLSIADSDQLANDTSEVIKDEVPQLKDEVENNQDYVIEISTSLMEVSSLDKEEVELVELDPKEVLDFPEDSRKGFSFTSSSYPKISYNPPNILNLHEQLSVPLAIHDFKELDPDVSFDDFDKIIHRYRSNITNKTQYLIPNDLSKEDLLEFNPMFLLHQRNWKKAFQEIDNTQFERSKRFRRYRFRRNSIMSILTLPKSPISVHKSKQKLHQL